MKKLIYNGKEVKEYAKHGNNEYYTLENDTKVFVLDSTIGLNSTDVQMIIDEDRGCVIINELDENGTTILNTVVASADEIHGLFLPSILRKMAVAKMIKLWSDMAIEAVKSSSAIDLTVRDFHLSMEELQSLKSE